MEKIQHYFEDRRFRWKMSIPSTGFWVKWSNMCNWFYKSRILENKKAQNIREILIKSGAKNEIKRPSVEILNIFNNEYEILKNQ